jgi:hypothetical protein
MTLSLAGFSFKGQKVERDCNNRECCNNLRAVEKFIQACHMVFCVNILLFVTLV